MKYLIITILLIALGFENATAQKIDFDLTEPSVFLQSSDLGDLEFADIDNDGDFDLIATGKGGPVATTIYMNDGSGNFSVLENDIFEDVYRSKVGVNDVDNDGDLDLLISGANNSPILSTILYLNDGQGNFSIALNTPFVPVDEGDFEFGDFDKDGDDDILMMGLSNQDLPVSIMYENDGSGTFSEAVSTAFKPLKFGAIELFDFDKDGDLDVLMNGMDVDDIPFTGLYENDGSGSFSLVANTPFSNMNSGDIAVGDSDNDGDLDVILCGNLSGSDIKTEFYLNDGLGQFSLMENSVFENLTFGETSFHDFDNDGDQDVFIIGTGPGGLLNNLILAHVYENMGANQFILADSLIGGYFSTHAIADINEDNYPDLVLGGTTTGIPARATWLYTNVTPMSVSTEEPGQAQEFEMYPNPTNGQLHIKLNQSDESKLLVYDPIGRQLLSREIQNNFAQLNLDLPNGIYNVVLKNRGGIRTQKLVVER